MLCNYWFMHSLPEDKRSFNSFYFEDRLVLIDTSSLYEINKPILANT